MGFRLTDGDTATRVTIVSNSGDVIYLDDLGGMYASDAEVPEAGAALVLTLLGGGIFCARSRRASAPGA